MLSDESPQIGSSDMQSARDPPGRRRLMFANAGPRLLHLIGLSNGQEDEADRHPYRRRR